MKEVVTYQDIQDAYVRIKPYIKLTELSVCEILSEQFQLEVILKHDYRQKTGSFKERGALNFLLMLSKEQRERGVVAASAGNHALGLCYHGRNLSIPVTVCIPNTAPIVKIERCQQLGANVIVAGKNFDEAKSFALSYAQEKHLAYVNGFNDPLVIAGQGTVMLEISQQIQHLDAVVVPVGGGGLIAGVAVAAKVLFPKCKIIGVESVLCDSMSQALQSKHPVTVTQDTTLSVADGLSVKTVGDNTFNILRTLCDQMIRVKEKYIFNAIHKLLDYERCVVEGAGATGVAALLSGQLDHLRDKKVAFILCGSNIDLLTLTNVVDRALFLTKRLANVSLLISDRPGGLLQLLRILHDHQINIREITKEKISIQTSAFLCKVTIGMEIPSVKQYESVKKTLQVQYGAAVVWNPH